MRSLIWLMSPPALKFTTRLLNSPGWLGKGKYANSAWAVGSMRPAMLLPGNCVLQAGPPDAQAELVKGSYMGKPEAEKSPLRSATVGTLVVSVLPLRRR